MSNQPVIDSQARASVLSAVDRFATMLASADVDAVAGENVTLQEVKDASKCQPPGSAPGVDGLPAGVWRLVDPGEKLLQPAERTGGVFRPLLSRLFTAIARERCVPLGFLDGAVVVLFKKGDVLDISNYRPITLLNTDYKLLAKVLANRLGPALGRSIGPEQTAFLPKRLIGSNILFLQMLPGALLDQVGRSEGLPCHGAVAFLDIAKAYDTVDRGFISDVLHRVQGAKIIPWLDLLLTGTKAVAVVNGVVSAPREWKAGVRQGCPLSPLLYDVVAWDLMCYLQACPGLGLAVQGCGSVHGQQYADDTQVLLRSASPEDVRPLQLAGPMAAEAYCAGTGQAINFGKSHLLQVGAVPEHAVVPTGQLVCGFPVVDKAMSLGMEFTNEVGGQVPLAAGAPRAGVDWPALTAKVKAALGRLARLHLSTFGFAFAASAYGVSKLVYHAEFMGLPVGVLDELSRWTKRLVDRGEAPPLAGAAHEQWCLPGVHSLLLSGHPKFGGFGLLPLDAHVKARHAVWGFRLIDHLFFPQSRSSLWLGLAAGSLARRAPAGQHLGLAFISFLSQRRFSATASFYGHSLPRPLNLMLQALSALGPLRPPLAGQRPPGAWCALSPLWGNPALESLVPDSCFDYHFSELSSVPDLRTVVDLRSLNGSLDGRASGPELARAIYALPYSTRILMDGPADLLAKLGDMWRFIPGQWRKAFAMAWPATRPSPGPDVLGSVDDGVLAAVSGWGWNVPCPAGSGVVQGQICLVGGVRSVKDITAVLLAPAVADRIARHREFVLSAAAPAAWF